MMGEISSMAYRTNRTPRRNNYNQSSAEYSDDDIFSLKSLNQANTDKNQGRSCEMHSSISPLRTERRGNNYSPTSVVVSTSNALNTPTNSGNKRHLLKCKTELCTLYPNCPWGIQCHFAHGPDDLKRLPLLQLARFGLIFVPVSEYRVRICPIWAMTGTCPFGGRCDGLHDPRVGMKDEYNSIYKAWLPHKDKREFVGDEYDTGCGLYVSANHYEQMACLHGNSSIFQPVKLFHSLTRQIQNFMQYTNLERLQDRVTNVEITHHHLLRILLNLTSATKDIPQEYKVTHSIDLPGGITPCMLCQKKVFICTEMGFVYPVESKIEVSGVLVLAVEVAFGPRHCPRARQQCVYFDLPDLDYVGQRMSCRRLNASHLPLVISHSNISLPVYRYTNQKSHEALFQNILRSHIVNINGDHNETLKQAHAMQKHLDKWQWPITLSRKDVEVTFEMLDPLVDDEYEVATEPGTLSNVWHSFLDMCDDEFQAQNSNNNRKRHDGFPRLLSDEEIKDEEKLSISAESIEERYAHSFLGITSLESIRSERCWRSILLKNKHNDWAEIQARFVEYM